MLTSTLALTTSDLNCWFVCILHYMVIQRANPILYYSLTCQVLIHCRMSANEWNPDHSKFHLSCDWFSVKLITWLIDLLDYIVMTPRKKQRECFLLFLCFRKLPKVQLTVMTNTGKNEHLTPTQLRYNAISCLTALPCQRNGQDVGELDIPGYGITHHLSSEP